MALEHHDYDVLVLGCGGSGLRAAIAAAEAGARTGLVCKSLLGKAHTVMAEGGLAASLGNVAPEDDWTTHFQDTMFGGKYLNNWRMAELHAREAPDRVRELEHWGAVFDRLPDRRMSQRAFGGHSHKRLVHVGDRTGLEIIRTLQEKAIHTDVEVFMETIVTRLIKDGDRVVGCLAYKSASGEQLTFAARAVVLATGGSGKVYKITSNSQDCTGDGLSLAYEAGAELLDMEFVQFHPTGMVFPPGVAGLLVTEAVRGEGGYLRNSEGERFMERYDPKRMELSTRDVVARSIYTEVKEGRGSPHGGVLLDISHLDTSFVLQKLPLMHEQFLTLAGVDITREPMEVGPTQHYFMGGVKVDADTGESTLPGLFAAGEVTGGMNGANRLGGNSLGDLLVFGRRAGVGAIQAAAQVERQPTLPADEVAAAQDQIDRYLNGPGSENPFLMHRELQAVMGEGVAIFRDAAGLQTAIARLEELERRAADLKAPSDQLVYNPGLRLCHELHSMVTVSLTIARAALMRTESRGCHSRLDHPDYDDYWSEHNIVVTRDVDGTMAFEPREVLKGEGLDELVEARKEAEKAA